VLHKYVKALPPLLSSSIDDSSLATALIEKEDSVKAISVAV
jgi:hypothetical protein